MRKAIILGLALCLLSAAPAGATIWTDTAEFQAAALLPALGSPLHFTSLESASADQNRLFTNTLGPLAVGTGIRTVGAVLITGVRYGTVGGPQNATGIVTPDGLHQWVAVFGIGGAVNQVVIPNVAGSALYSTGRMELVQVPIGTFVAQDPTTWGFLAVGAPGEYSLIGQDLVLPGAQPGNPLSTNLSAWPEQTTYLPSFTDVGALNTQIGVATQGVFLFNEDPAHNILNTDSGQILPSPPVPPVSSVPPYPGVSEGLVVQTAQTIVNVTEGYLTPAMEAVLNAIGNWGFGLNFANFGAGGYSDFVVTISPGGPPNFVIDNGINGLDFTANLGASAEPTLHYVPEPISAIVWGGIALLSLVWGLARKRR